MTRRQLLHLLTAVPALAVTGCAAQPASSEQETEPAGEGESDRNALVMDHVRK